MSKNFDLGDEGKGDQALNVNMLKPNALNSTFSLAPGDTVPIKVGLKGPMNINNTQGSIINLLEGSSLGPCTITSFNDHLEVVFSGNIIEY